MRTIRKLTPALLKRIISEEKQKIKLEMLREAKKKKIAKKRKINITKKQLIELALIHKKQKEAASNFKWLHEKKERIKNNIKKKR